MNFYVFYYCFQYPFLKDDWTTYKDFDKNVEDDKTSYDSLCDIILNGSSVELKKYKDFCMKLMRNLGRFSSVRKIYAPTLERCKMLNNWIYNSIEKNKITVDILNKCFIEYTSYMDKIKNYKRCFNFSNYKIYEPTKITLLDVFDNNTQIIKETLMNRDFSISAPGRKYVCECVKIYKKMNDEYCVNEEGKREDYRNTCLKLKQFKGVYNFFRDTLNGLSPSLPSMNDSDEEFMVKCPSEISNNVLTPEGAKNPEGTSEMEIFQDTEDHGRKLTDDLPVHSETVDSPMKKTITTTIGTVAGASSLLAFLYKVHTKFYLNICIILHSYDCAMFSY
ncbi:hypothetical protein PVNG_02162 [Plasmodium vivax North Korean]|uniref:Variable surface protein n=1 Tax=Plasmodium vivax North Korean TaxID=1035514 RepID=A0A0J9TUN7_PLAVI|nr:hypothetical protein PVNG_02162 [Plasmodium vivax North Korean]